MQIQAAIVLVVIFFFMLAMSVPISFSIIASALITIIMFLNPQFGMFISAQKMASGIDSFSMLAVPFFILAGQLMSSTGRQVTGSFRWHPVSSVARSRTGAPHSSNSIPIVRVVCGVLPEKCNTSHTAPQLAAESSSNTTGEMRRYTVRFAVCSSGVPVRRITAMQSPASRMLSAAYQHTAVTKRRSPCSPKATPTTAQAVSILYRIWAGYESSGANKISALSEAMPLAHTMRENAAC